MKFERSPPSRNRGSSSRTLDCSLGILLVLRLFDMLRLLLATSSFFDGRALERFRSLLVVGCVDAAQLCEIGIVSKN